MTAAAPTLAQPSVAAVRAVPAWATPVAVGLLGALVGVAFTWVPYGWSDEVATQTLVTRPLGSFLKTVTLHVDAVHATYYLAMRLWATIFGSSIVALRIPSAIAVGVAAVGVHRLGARLADRRVALIGALLFLTVPMTMWAAGEARSYSFSMAAAVWLTVLLIWAADGPRRRWIAYAAAAAASAYLFLYLLLVVLAHAVTVLLSARLRRNLIRLLVADGAAALAAAPLVLLASREQDQVGWISPLGPQTLGQIAAEWFVGSYWYEGVAWLLVIAGVVVLVMRRSGPSSREALRVLLPWLVLPTLVLVLGSALGKPMYVQRYALMSLPAAALLMGAAANRLKRASALAVVVLAALCAPVYLHQRAPLVKGVDWGEDAAFVAQHRTSQAGFYFADPSAARAPRQMLGEYAATFSGMADIGVWRTGAKRHRIWDSEVTPRTAAARAAGLRTVIVIGDREPRVEFVRAVAAFEHAGLRVEASGWFPWTRAVVLAR
ncbi:glycosyltransferase family 39 protein [Amnibacterium sp. CER49]|uniref:glycosyltransferase family 39 protein n=1 Tax=Amnibacterium sp. CER49 TaxID=3039161 RepID=UPI00244B0267|nr:glycosyltransferase family 39 protein [Amnibacterium sp. CER49]MDH2443050.1 glycosyltransferase family 39 protein [Amnibacterium sp. CER49]